MVNSECDNVLNYTGEKVSLFIGIERISANCVIPSAYFLGN